MVCPFCGKDSFSDDNGVITCDNCGTVVYHEGMKKKQESYFNLTGEDVDALRSCKEYNL